MKFTLLFALLATCAFAQEKGNVIFHSTGSVSASAVGVSANSVVGAPYSATVTHETVQTLADGNRIVQSSTGNMARDSQGRTRQDMPLPALGGLSAANAPHLVFVHDPVSQTSYTLNLSEKTAQKLPALPALSGDAAAEGGPVKVVFGGGAPLPPPDTVAGLESSLNTAGVFIQKQVAEEPAQVATEDLGSETMEGVVVNGTRTTRTIPAGEVGNDKPITITTEVWTSPDLKTVIYSKRSDPRMGETTFHLSKVVRAEPDPSLFTIPPDFRIVDTPQPILYRAKP